MDPNSPSVTPASNTNFNDECPSLQDSVPAELDVTEAEDVAYSFTPALLLDATDLCSMGPIEETNHNESAPASSSLCLSCIHCGRIEQANAASFLSTGVLQLDLCELADRHKSIYIPPLQISNLQQIDHLIENLMSVRSNLSEATAPDDLLSSLTDISDSTPNLVVQVEEEPEATSPEPAPIREEVLKQLMHNKTLIDSRQKRLRCQEEKCPTTKKQKLFHLFQSMLPKTKK